jgi:hypothetical protein
MPNHIVIKEADLFPIIKKSFNEQGYRVFAEVACMYRGVDMVAVKEDEHTAIELKTTLSDHLLRQASWNINHFDKVYIAYPVKKAIMFHVDDVFWKLRETTQQKYTYCENRGIGILQVLPSGLIYEALEPTIQKPFRKLDLQHYVEADEDLGGLPYQKGVSEGYHELESIKKYVTANPQASWQEIYDNVSNHYSSARSLAGSMSQWRGFYLSEFKKSIGVVEPQKPKPQKLL